jgi:hypothetical protein
VSLYWIKNGNCGTMKGGRKKRTRIGKESETKCNILCYFWELFIHWWLTFPALHVFTSEILNGINTLPGHGSVNEEVPLPLGRVQHLMGMLCDHSVFGNVPPSRPMGCVGGDSTQHPFSHSLSLSPYKPAIARRSYYDHWKHWFQTSSQLHWLTRSKMRNS